MKAPLSYVPALPPAIGVMAGILIFYLGGENWIWLATLFVTAVIFLIIKSHWFGFMFLFGTLGWTVAYMSLPEEPAPQIINARRDFTAQIEDVRVTSAATVFTLKIDDFLCAGILPSVEKQYRPGDIVSFNSKIETLDRLQDIPDERSVNPTYFVDGITAQTYMSPDKIHVIGHINTPKRVARHLREELRDLIYLSPISDGTAWFLSATLLGDDSMLDRGVKEEFRATGTAHYLALSGFHVAIIAMFAGMLLFPFKTWSHAGRYRHLIVITLIWIYAFACGLSASLVRAATLITIFLAAKILQRQSSPFNSLAIASIIILIASPRQLFGVGFQLSFAAVLSILLFSRILNPVGRRHHFAYRLMEYVTVTLSATLGTCLIMICHFHRFPLLFLLPNILLGVMMPLLLGAGIILMISTAFGLQFTILGKFTDFGYLAIERLCDFIAAIGHAEIRGIYLTPMTISLGALTIILLAVTLRFRRRWLTMLNIAALILTFASSQLKAQSEPTELFITRQSSRTDILIRHQSGCRLLTTAPVGQHQQISSQLSRRYQDYLLRRDCPDSLSIIDGDFSLGPIRRHGDMLYFHNKSIVIAAAPTLIVDLNKQIDYLLLTRAAGANALSLIELLNVSEILVSADIPPKRAEKIAARCRELNLPFRNLKNETFILRPDL